MTIFTDAYSFTIILLFKMDKILIHRRPVEMCKTRIISEARMLEGERRRCLD